MSVITAERIKFTTTKSPLWCALGASGLLAAYGIYKAGNPGDGGYQLAPLMNMSQLGMSIILVMAALAVTTEIRFNTMRATFLAVPRRANALLAKGLVVATIAGIVGEISAWFTWGAAYAISHGSPNLAINNVADFRVVAGVGVIYFFGVLLAMGVALLVRQSAGAISILLVWSLLLETLTAGFWNSAAQWLPFLNAQNFLSGKGGNVSSGGPFSPVGSGVYFAAVSLAVFVIGMAVTRRRDA
jgi:ABC-2 type transport system permease protein